MSESTPITFVEPSYALLDVEHNAVISTEWGNLAIFSTPGVAENMAKMSVRRLKVIKVMITPVVEQ